MTVVCNATPIINFVVINRLDILQAVFRQIVIPQAVYDETTGSGFPGSRFVLQATTSGWLQVRSVSTIESTILLELDDGEREAITLALKTGEQRILPYGARSSPSSSKFWITSDWYSWHFIVGKKSTDYSLTGRQNSLKSLFGKECSDLW